MRTPISPRALLAAAALLPACSPWTREVPYEDWRTSLGWSPEAVVSGEAAYFAVDGAHPLQRVTPDGYGPVDLDGATPVALFPVPGGDQELIGFLRWPVCGSDDPEIELASDCPADELSEAQELAWIDGSRRSRAEAVPRQFNTLAFAPGGGLAVSWMNQNQLESGDIEGIVDPTELLFLPLDGGAAHRVSTGQRPRGVLFTQGADGADQHAVLLADNWVSVFDLASHEQLVGFPLTQDQDARVVPSAAVSAQDGDVVLVSTRQSADLYKLDLARKSIDIEDLDGAPSNLVPVQVPGDGGDQPMTMVLYDDLARVDLLDHASWEMLHQLELEEPVNQAHVFGDRALLYNDEQETYDAYLVDLGTRHVSELRLSNPVISLVPSDSGRFAAATLRPGYGGGVQAESYGFAVIDLEAEEATSLILPDEPLGMALVDDGDVTYALLLIRGQDTLLQVDLRQPTNPVEIELTTPPLGIQALPDGRFLIALASPLGTAAFLDPVTGKVQEITGFAAGALYPDELPLPRRAQD
jgi:hypothetical protein